MSTAIPALEDEVRLVEQLNVEEFPRGVTSKVLVELVQDGLGMPVRAPVLVARGEKHGPVFGLTSTLHGNELNGIRVIHQLLQQVDLAKLRGTILAVVVVNVPGFLTHQRWFSDGMDLNHIMPGSPQGSVSQVYAHRVVHRCLEKFEYLADLHTASFGRANSLYVRADMTHELTAAMAYLQRPQIIVHNPASDKTLRGTAMERGIPAITIEIGNPHQFQPKYIQSTLIGLRSILARVDMLPRRPVAMGPPPVLCERSYWLYTNHGGLLEVFPSVAQMVEKNEVIARLTDVFGHVTQEYRAPESGVIVGKNVEPVAETGARIIHLGIVAKPSDQRFWARWQTAEYAVVETEEFVELEED